MMLTFIVLSAAMVTNLGKFIANYCSSRKLLADKRKLAKIVFLMQVPRMMWCIYIPNSISAPTINKIGALHAHKYFTTDVTFKCGQCSYMFKISYKSRNGNGKRNVDFTRTRSS